MPFYIFTPSTQRLSREIENGFYEQKFIPLVPSAYRRYIKCFCSKLSQGFYSMSLSCTGIWYQISGSMLNKLFPKISRYWKRQLTYIYCVLRATCSRHSLSQFEPFSNMRFFSVMFINYKIKEFKFSRSKVRLKRKCTLFSS